MIKVTKKLQIKISPKLSIKISPKEQRIRLYSLRVAQDLAIFTGGPVPATRSI